MSRSELPRVRQLVRLRDVEFDIAMRTLAAAGRGLAEAEAALDAATAERDASLAHRYATRSALVACPADAPTALARIDHAAELAAAAEAGIEVAAAARIAAEQQLVAARQAVRRAEARLTSMTEHAIQLARRQRRVSEERAALESEDEMAGRAARRRLS